ncbi:Fe-Mn family superoxide dismutase [Paenibacillus polysaccharolyticus]|uniref:Fe-Mn family superoxide dismutase n=1 Tax=Paenibacillus polysaccharolyticus TaxID=582692 RepID=UPI002959AE91|nr:Fe-Mn family superoxide dismutase [Paenibacillus intestini]
MNCDGYGHLLPLRTLEEIRFWKEQEKEHTLIIRTLVPDLEPSYVKLLEEWEAAFANSERVANQLIKQLLPATQPPAPYIMRSIDQLVQTAKHQSKEFIKQLYIMLERSAAVRAVPLAQTFILHIIRESEYFLGVLETLSQPGILRETEPPSSMLLENALHNIKSKVAQDTRLEATELQASLAGQTNTNTSISPSASAQVQSLSLQPSTAGTAPAETLPASAPVREKPVPIGGHTLPPLPYAYNALEPHIDELTMRIHHDKHHQSYVDGLNVAEKKLAESRKKNNFELIKHWERELAFNGAGHYLHTIFWTIMNPAGGGKPTGMLAEQIKRDFGSYEAFKNQFTEAANKVEGSGWAMLVWSPRAHRLEILQAEKHQNLSQSDIVPLLPLDVWEHAYYLKHQNERKKYIEDWWNVVYWPAVAERYETARKLLWPPY